MLALVLTVDSNVCVFNRKKNCFKIVVAYSLYTHALNCWRSRPLEKVSVAPMVGLLCFSPLSPLLTISGPLPNCQFATSGETSESLKVADNLHELQIQTNYKLKRRVTMQECLSCIRRFNLENVSNFSFPCFNYSLVNTENVKTAQTFNGICILIGNTKTIKHVSVI